MKSSRESRRSSSIPRPSRALRPSVLPRPWPSLSSSMFLRGAPFSRAEPSRSGPSMRSRGRCRSSSRGARRSSVCEGASGWCAAAIAGTPRLSSSMRTADLVRIKFIARLLRDIGVDMGYRSRRSLLSGSSADNPVHHAWIGAPHHVPGPVPPRSRAGTSCWQYNAHGGRRLLKQEENTDTKEVRTSGLSSKRAYSSHRHRRTAQRGQVLPHEHARPVQGLDRGPDSRRDA